MYMCELLQTILATKVPACFESPISGAQGNGLGFQARSRLTKIAKHLVIPMSEKSRTFRKLTVVLFTITLQGSCFKRTLTPGEGGGGGEGMDFMGKDYAPVWFPVVETGS